MANEFQLGGIVPWGRTAAEYEAFFGLSDLGKPRRILDCGGGPASVTAEWGARGHFAVSADPLYAKAPGRIHAEFEPTASRMLEGMRAARGRFHWEYYDSPEDVLERRRQALDTFVADRLAAIPTGRYVAARLPHLPFAANSFDLVLCSHLLFLYSDELSMEMHVDALQEMLRVGHEVRTFPLVDLHGQPSLHVQPVLEHFSRQAICDIVPVPFEFQHGASKMLRLSRRA